MKTTFFTFLIFIPFISFAQAFMPSFSSGMETPKGKVILKSGETISGTFGLIASTENIKSLRIKDEAGEKHKVSAEDISKVLIEVADLALVTTKTSSLKDMMQTDYEALLKADFFVWEPAITPKKGKMLVLQLVNPGYDSQMKVYRDPTAKETKGVAVGGMQLTGGIEKSYYLVKAGENTAVKLEKRKYSKQFEEIFTKDCPNLAQMMDGKKVDWDDLPAHVMLYDQTCGK